MNCAEVISTLEDLAENPEQRLDPNRVHALYFAIAVIRTLPPNQSDCIDVILDLEHARQKQ